MSEAITTPPESAEAALRELVRGDPSALPEIARRNGVVLLVLFGSTAKGRPRRPKSDLDIGALFAGPPEDESWISEEAQLYDDLEVALRPNCELQVVVLNRANPMLQKQVAEHGLVLYADRPERWWVFRMRARKYYEDTEKYRRRRWEWVLRRFGPGVNDTATGR